MLIQLLPFLYLLGISGASASCAVCVSIWDEAAYHGVRAQGSLKTWDKTEALQEKAESVMAVEKKEAVPYEDRT